MQARLHRGFRAREACGHLNGGGTPDGKINGEMWEPRRVGQQQDFGDALTFRLHAGVEGGFEEPVERDLVVLGSKKRMGLCRDLTIEHGPGWRAARPPGDELSKEFTQARPAFRRVSPSALL
jgi:hypothetical protein